MEEEEEEEEKEVEEDKEQYLKLSCEASIGLKLGDFIFLASGYEGGWPVRALAYFPTDTVSLRSNYLSRAELARLYYNKNFIIENL